MKKVLIISLSALAALLITGAVIFFVLFAGKSEHYSAIPDSSVYLVKVNTGNLLKKSEILQQPVVETATDMVVKSMPRDARELMREIFEDPSASGIDIDKPAVLAFENFNSVKGVFVMAVKDRARVEEVVELFADEVPEVKLDNRGDITYVEFGSNRRSNPVSVAFDTDMFVVAFDQRNADAEEYFNLDDDEQAVNNKLFSKFFAKNDDAAMFLNFGELTNSSVLRLNRSEKQMLSMLEGSTLFMNLNFENGYAEMSASIDASDDYRKLLEDAWIDVDHKHFEYIPYNAIGVACFGVNMGNVLEMDGMDEVVKELGEIGFTRSMIESVVGEFTFAMLPVEKLGRDDVPQFMFVGDCEERAVFDKVVRMMKSEDIIKRVDDDVYALGLNKYRDYNWDDYSYIERTGGYDYYLMYNDGKVFVLPENVYEELVDDGELVSMDKSLADNKLFTSFKGMGMFVDMSAVIDAVEASAGRIGNDERMLLGFIEVFESAEVVAEEPFEIKARVSLTDKDENFLKVMVDEIFSVFSKEIMRNL